MPLQVRVAGETFCASCGETFLPTTSALGAEEHDHHRKPCCNRPRIVNLAAFLKPEEIAQ